MITECGVRIPWQIFSFGTTSFTIQPLRFLSRRTLAFHSNPNCLNENTAILQHVNKKRGCPVKGNLSNVNQENIPADNFHSTTLMQHVNKFRFHSENIFRSELLMCRTFEGGKMWGWVVK